MDIKKAKKNLFTSLGGCSIDPILHLSSIASKTENREIKELITWFSVFIEQSAAALCSLPSSAHWSVGLWRGREQMAQALNGSLKG